MKKDGLNGFLAKMEMRGIERVLEGEDVVDAISGTGGISQNGVKQNEEHCALVLTSTRVILYNKKIMGHSSVDFQLSKINNVVLDVGIVYADIKVHSADDIIVIRKLPKNVGERFAKNLKAFVSRVNNQTSVASNVQTLVESQKPSVSQTTGIDIADQLKKLAELKDQGILTEEEFTMQKKKLLGL